MKPTKDIIGLRIISISDGTQVGVVKDLVLNPQGKTLDFMIIDQPSDYFGAKVIPFADILGMGEFAITVPDLSIIQDVAQNMEAQNLLKQDIRVIGTKVLTKKGQLIGQVTEVLIDEETGHIASCTFESEGKIHEISAEQIITLGKELLIIEADKLVQNPVIPDTPPETPAQSKQEPSVTATPVTESLEDLTKVTDNSNEEQEAGFNLFEQRQLQYFIGKKVDKTIILDNGDSLKAGETITAEIVTYITTRSTLMEVTSHLQKN